MFRIGTGYDSHRFAAGRPLMLCNVRVPSELGLAGHSDADAALHALTDAILGAISAGDIGQHFSDSDPRWKDADSSAFLVHAVKLAAEKNFRVANCDLTIITQSPRLGPLKDKMRQRLAELLGTPADRVSVKAKSNEGMGFIGRGEGLAVIAVVLLEKI
ncbi:MAG: 2-C-methyl-D-erythritol 2,4-cyclodiphosphate synthase [Planctomycetes bacterium]|nr:2-C-methyl-D-erythritol 2,4-cyclodiphosphate synthase [Planctomycetota bacterium]